MAYYAHSAKDGSPPPAGWQPLAEHLRGVAELSRQFAEAARPILPDAPEPLRAEKRAFHAAACAAGLLHDVGKFQLRALKIVRVSLFQRLATIGGQNCETLRSQF